MIKTDLVESTVKATVQETGSTMDHFVNAARDFLNNVVFSNIPKLIVALLVLFIGLKLIKLLNKIMTKSYQRHKVEPSLRQFLNSLIDATLKILLVLTVMNIIGIQMTSFVAIIGAAGLAVGMALQGTLQNFAGGVIILLLKPFKVGDYIEQGSYAGTVKTIRIFSTSLSTVDNLTIIVPNTELATKSLVNYSNMPARRVIVKVGIAYGESIEKARKVLLATVAKQPTLLHEPAEPSVVVTSLADSSVNLSLVLWVEPQNYFPTLYALNQSVYEAFNEAGVEIPFNQLDVHVKRTE